MPASKPFSAAALLGRPAEGLREDDFVARVREVAALRDEIGRALLGELSDQVVGDLVDQPREVAAQGARRERSRESRL